LLDGISNHLEMLVDVSGVSPVTSEHPHKLSQQIVKELFTPPTRLTRRRRTILQVSIGVSSGRVAMHRIRLLPVD